MGATKRRMRAVRRSISLPAETDTRVKQLARRENRSASRVLENLIEAGLQAREAERRHFFELTERLRASTDAIEIQQIKSELARITFGV